MARSQLTLLVAALAISATGCDRLEKTSYSAVTVKLPPARPHVPMPAFTFRNEAKAKVPARP